MVRIRGETQVDQPAHTCVSLLLIMDSQIVNQSINQPTNQTLIMTLQRKPIFDRNLPQLLESKTLEPDRIERGRWWSEVCVIQQELEAEDWETEREGEGESRERRLRRRMNGRGKSVISSPISLAWLYRDFLARCCCLLYSRAYAFLILALPFRHVMVQVILRELWPKENFHFWVENKNTSREFKI